MNKLDRRLKVTDHEADYALWCAEQGALLREGRFDALDRENLAEEIESLERSERYEIDSRLKVLLVHLLKWRFQPKARLLRDSPSLKQYPAEILAAEYELAMPNAADETGLPEEIFPPECPFTIEQVLDQDWLPEAAGQE